MLISPQAPDSDRLFSDFNSHVNHVCYIELLIASLWLNHLRTPTPRGNISLNGLEWESTRWHTLHPGLILVELVCTLFNLLVLSLELYLHFHQSIKICWDRNFKMSMLTCK